MKNKIKKIIKKGNKKKNKLMKKFDSFFYNKVNKRKIKLRRRITIKQLFNCLDIPIPKEMEKYKNKKIEKITRWPQKLVPNSVFFCSSIDKHILEFPDLKEKCICIFSEEPIKDCINIVIKNSNLALRKTIRYIRTLHKGPVIAVTGSIGKTSSKDMIKNVLKTKFKNILVSSGNSNTYPNIVEYIQKLSKLDKVYLQEVGIGSLKQIIKSIAVVLEADIVVYTNIYDSHIEHYGTRENIAAYKTLLSKYGNPNGIAIINYDDEILKKIKFKQEVISYSLEDNNATYYAKDITTNTYGTTFIIVDNKNKKQLSVKLSVIGKHHVQNALAAYAIAEHLKLSSKQIKKGLKAYKTSGMRSNIISLGKYKIFADCYNASLESIESSINTLNILTPKGKGKKIAVIGDISELGDMSSKIHRKVGQLLLKYDIDKIIFFGNYTRYSYEEYKKCKNNSVFISEREELHKYIEKNIKENDIILFKASHSMELTETIDIVFGTNLIDSYTIDKVPFEDDNYVYSLSKLTATLCLCKSKNKKIILPEKINELPITKIGSKAFQNNKFIKELVFSKFIKRIGLKAFQNSSIEKIKFNENLKQISLEAFKNCNNLKEVEFSKSLISIKKGAFENCNNLTKVVIPSKITVIEKDVFKNCNKNLVIHCDKDSICKQFCIDNKIKYIEY